MKIALVALLALCAVAVAEERARRQVNYQFPGPRQGQPQDDSGLYQQPRRQFQAQPVQSYGAAPRAAAPQQQQSYGAAPQQAPARRPAASSRTRYAGDSQQDVEENPEEEQGPDPLALLLQDSKFSCGSKKDGYYADNSVNCQAFHYCVAGAKHSWMCPAGTTFHQVHLNCVPNNQDTTLCGQAEKFYFVNDYLHKELDQRGPNNTVQYAQRYYPDGYTIGDTFVAPGQGGGNQYQGDQYQQAPAPQGRPQAASYGGGGGGGGAGGLPPQYRQQAPPAQQYAPAARPNYGPPPQRQAYVPQAAAPPPRAAAAPQQSYGYGQSPSGGVPNLDDVRIPGLPSLPQVPQAQPQPQHRRPAGGPAPNLAARTAAVQPYGGAYQVSGARQVRYDDDRGY